MIIVLLFGEIHLVAYCKNKMYWHDLCVSKMLALYRLQRIHT